MGNCCNLMGMFFLFDWVGFVGIWHCQRCFHYDIFVWNEFLWWASLFPRCLSNNFQISIYTGPLGMTERCRCNKFQTQKKQNYYYLDPPRGAKLMGKGMERVPLSNPLGFKHHPLEGAGKFWSISKSNSRMSLTRATTPVALSSRGNFSEVCCILSFQEGIKHSHRWEVSLSVFFFFGVL